MTEIQFAELAKIPTIQGSLKEEQDMIEEFGID